MPERSEGGVERDYEAEIVTTFGARLKRVYHVEDAALPPQVADCLERLKQAEANRASSGAEDPQSPR